MHSSELREEIVSAMLRKGLLCSERFPVVSVLDFDGIRRNIRALYDAFPPHVDVQHTFAVKANSLPSVLRELRLMGMGAEVASQGELRKALEAGHEASDIVFDSPAKTRLELKNALASGVAINIDNFQELRRIKELSLELRTTVPETAFRAGIRVNPQVGEGKISAMSTAGMHSKFGIPLRDLGMREQIIEAYLDHPWLTRIHTHVGSQGCALELIANGIRDVTLLAEEINLRVGRKQIQTIDIGGGMPVEFDRDTLDSRYAEYVDVVQSAVPELFTGAYSLVTEFGRSVIAKHGITLANVEYTKEVGGRQIAITHAGAQVAARTVFMPDAWPLRVEVFDAAGKRKPGGNECHQDVAGPCCFAGDVVATNRLLPPMVQGDVVALLDTGAYYASTPFDYNSLPLPGVYGVRKEGSSLRFSTLREPADFI